MGKDKYKESMAARNFLQEAIKYVVAASNGNKYSYSDSYSKDIRWSIKKSREGHRKRSASNVRIQ